MDEISGMAELRHVLLGASLEDVTRGIDRCVRYQRNELSFDCIYCPQTEEIRQATLNGAPLDQPRFSATGLPRDFQPIPEGR